MPQIEGREREYDDTPVYGSPHPDDWDQEWDQSRGWRWLQGQTPRQPNRGPDSPLGAADWRWMGLDPAGSFGRTDQYGWQLRPSSSIVPRTDATDPNNPANIPPAGAPPPSGPAPSSGPSSGGDPFSGESWGERAPMLGYPDYESAGPFTPRRDTFSFDPFKASSWADAENEPGYQASRDQLRKQVEAGAAHRGMVLSGMTIGNLYKNLDAQAQQNFTQFDDRNFRNWSGNRDLAATKFGLELGVDRDVYDRRATDIDRKNNYRFNVADASFKDALARWTERTRSLTEMARPIP